ncbi:MAG: hypothetical protein HY336_02075 [Candidatus Doudnabacteria bacterium]|nr:hypothetical protein [Candidatus Doudnabacteria bacterium]
MAREIDLDEVMLSIETVRGWLAKVRESGPLLKGLDPEEIPDERCRVNDDGSLTIFVVLPGGEVSMDVSRSHWTYRH